MAEFHGLAARVTLLLALLVAGWSIALAATRRPLRPVLLGALVWLVILLAASGALGIGVAIAAGPPADPLHLVYGLLAVAVLPGAWAVARLREDARRTVIVLAVASLVELILVFRLFQTGG
ncbi:MAG: hypothetical protein AABZ33_10590 [Chloroflexota bacterium]